jgi:hypothetical protein
MKLPRVRFTVRRLMVAVVAQTVWCLILVRRSAEYRLLALIGPFLGARPG